MDRSTITLAVSGQALIKADPRKYWGDPYGTIRPIVETADIGFTNFEMAVNPAGNGCNLPDDYVSVIGQARRIEESLQPGNTSWPHAVEADVMEFLASMNFNLMSLANNHIWDLGSCGVRATIEAANRHGVTHAGAGDTLQSATAPAVLTVRGQRIALVASTTGHDERDLLIGDVNGVWTGHQEDWDRNIAAVEQAADMADFVICYQHFQIDGDEFDGMKAGEATKHGHIKVDDVAEWQDAFARATIDAGAAIYIGHGHRGFDGVEIYRGRPLFRQFGGFAYQGLQPVGSYEGEFAFWGLLGVLKIEDGLVTSMEFVPLEMDEGGSYEGTCGDIEFYSKRGFAEVADRPVAAEILERFRQLSKKYGAEVEIKGDRAFMTIG